MGATEPEKLGAETYETLCKNVEAENEKGKQHRRRDMLSKSYYGSVM